ncbi:MAG: hypothetical protein PHW58_05930 [Candidatus Methanofastidiosa archaeon]|jgi:hypothetical protein|nr:hypothetical protein [Candidatus Methanofastidiosa archaeon]
MADLRFKAKRVRDEKEYTLRKAELKRYLSSFPAEQKGRAQLLMSQIAVLQKKQNTVGYLSFFAMALGIAAYTMGAPQSRVGTIALAGCVVSFALLLFVLVALAYRAHVMRRELGALRAPPAPLQD